MPFGVVYATLFYAALGLWFVLGGSVEPLNVSRFFLGPAALALAGGLVLRRRWAHWLGAAVAAALVGATIVFGLSGGTALLVVLFGSLLTLVLLLIPATGGLSPDGDGATQRAPRLGRVLALTAALGMLGAVGSVWWGEAETRGERAMESAGAVQVEDLPDRVAWSHFGDGLARARAEAKPMVVSFETSWCGYCRKMNRETWKHPSVIESLAEIVAVRVNAEDARERNGFRGQDLANRYKVTGYPTILLIDADGRVLNRTGGFLNPRQFLDWLERSLTRVGRDPAGTIRVSGP